MRIDSLTLSNFQCFGPEPTTIDLADLTAFVGTNGSGKSAVLQALCRLFGTVNSERQLRRSDFHIPRGKTEDDIDEVTLFLEARIAFPELEGEADSADAVAECFKQMIVDSEGEAPFCRVRLEGRWSQSNLPGGDIEQSISWICSGETEPREEDKRQMRAFERSRIHVHYVPAARDPLKQLRHVSGTIMHRLLNAVVWSDNVKESHADASESVFEAFAKEGGVEVIQKEITENWQELHTADAYSNVSIRPMSSRFEDMLRQIEISFRPAPDGQEDKIDRLSDGLKSLFYLSMVGASFGIEESLLEDGADAGGIADAISQERLNPPSLTLFAVEEPENHLAPHYLGRILSVLRKMAASARGQVVLTSHSPSVMGRIEPEEVRYLRLDESSNTTMVRTIILPEATDGAHKYVRQAVRAYPELYFARFVILGEGDSEEIVLPRLAAALGLPIDRSFVSVVPLGGRHVNHFWRLLNDLQIPFCTLLDLDRERGGGGWGRIKYVCKQLLLIGKEREDILTVDDGAGGTRILSDHEFDEMHTWDVSEIKSLNGWAGELEKHAVFFSRPLDLDFTMLRGFKKAYEATATDGHGPQIPGETDAGYSDSRQRALAAVLKSADAKGVTYKKYRASRFFWYRYLFLGRGKPTTHIMALASLSNEEIAEKCPEMLKRLVEHVKGELGMDGGGDVAES